MQTIYIIIQIGMKEGIPTFADAPFTMELNFLMRFGLFSNNIVAILDISVVDVSKHL